jgi:hypothetical protein
MIRQNPLYSQVPIAGYYAWPYQYVEDSGPVEQLVEDVSLSRCPDEPRNPARTLFLAGRSLGISAIDVNGLFIHFVIPSDFLQFRNYTSRGAIISKAAYGLTMEVLSEDLRSVAPPGAIAIMSCKNGRYVGAQSVRVYKGEVRLESIDPVFDSGIGNDDDNCSTQLTDDPNEPGYNPYDSTTETGCSDGNGSGGSGTQYSPGDHTGGETVDWQTGQGNGGPSACGEAAVVEYVCIDVWNGSDWVEWGCGYVTTC